MIVYHATNKKAAAAIERGGFRDNTGRYMTEHLWSGVWVANDPSEGNFQFDDPVVFQIDTREETLSEWEWIEEGKLYREWLVPAAVLNRFARRRIARMPFVVYPSGLIGCIPNDLPTPDSEAFDELNTAQVRYYILNWIIDDDVISVESAAADRAQFARFCTPGTIDPQLMVDFMHAATGLPRGWCVTWFYLNEFSQLNAGVISGIDSINDRETFLKELLAEALELLAGTTQ